MNCRDFDRTWNERLDAGAEPSGAEALALEAHAGACPACNEAKGRWPLLPFLLLRLWASNAGEGARGRRRRFSRL